MKVFARDPAWDERMLYSLNEQLPSLLVNRDSTLNHRNGQQTLAADILGVHVIVKRYIGAYGWAARCRPQSLGRALRSYSHASRLRQCGIPTPRALLCASFGVDMVTVTERLHANELYEAMRVQGWLNNWEDSIAQKLAALMQTTSTHHITHGDLHARNLLVDQSCNLWLIDLDGLRFHRSDFFYRRRRAKEEHRLGKSLYHASPRLCRKSGFVLEKNRWLWRSTG